MATDITVMSRSSNVRALATLALTLSVLAAACGGGTPEPIACGVDRHFGGQDEWTDDATLCFEDAWSRRVPATMEITGVAISGGVETVGYRITDDGMVEVTSQSELLGEVTETCAGLRFRRSGTGPPLLELSACS